MTTDPAAAAGSPDSDHPFSVDAPDEDTSRQWPPREFDTGVPHSARVYDYWLGGKDNFAADREMAEMILSQIPSMRQMANENREFVTRATAFLAAHGINQFLDIGTGIPTSPNLHETAQAIIPDARVVYLDNDPIVLAHARALMPSSSGGQVAYVDADLRDPRRILANPALNEILDPRRPVALMLIAVLMLLDDDDDPYGTVDALREALPSGSYLALTHPTQDFDPDTMAVVTGAARASGMTFQPRREAEVARFLGDWQLVSPGLVPVRAWRPAVDPEDPTSAYYWAAVARKP